MIYDDDEVKISKSLIKTDLEIKIKKLKMEKNKNRKSYKKPITKQNLQDTLDFAFNDLELFTITMTQDLTTSTTLKL